MAAPIVLFGYRREKHLKATIEALERNTMAASSDLFLYLDGPKNDMARSDVDAVRRYAREFARRSRSFRSVHLIEREENLGLARSVINGVSDAMNAHGRAIVLEDDIITAPMFLTFMNQALDVYSDTKSIFSVSGWTPPVRIPKDYPADIYLCRRALCWGWGSWSDRWDPIDWNVGTFDAFEKDKKAKARFARGGDDLPDMLRHDRQGRVSSWAVRFCYAQFMLGAYSAVSTTPLAVNRGFDDTGENCSSRQTVASAGLDLVKCSFRLSTDLQLNEEICRDFKSFYAYNWRARVKKLLGLL